MSEVTIIGVDLPPGNLTNSLDTVGKARRFWAERLALRSKVPILILRRSSLTMASDDTEPEKKSWFSPGFGDSAAIIAGFTLQVSSGNSPSKPKF